jgi:hypothetical protein
VNKEKRSRRGGCAALQGGFFVKNDENAFFLPEAVTKCPPSRLYP